VSFWKLCELRELRVRGNEYTLNTGRQIDRANHKKLYVPERGTRPGGYPPGIFFLLRAGLGFTLVGNRLIGGFFWGLRQLPAPPPGGLNGGVLGGPLPLKMWILPGQGQGSKLKSLSDGQIINFDRGYLVVKIET
jgi:hypothetical protein